MHYNTRTFPLEDITETKQSIRQLATHQEVATLLDNNEYPHDKYRKYEVILGFDPVSTFTGSLHRNVDTLFENFKSWRSHQPFCLGYFGYDLKNELEDLSSQNKILYPAPDIFFFCPGSLILIKDGRLEIKSIHDPESIYQKLMAIGSVSKGASPRLLRISSFPDRVQYMKTVDAIRRHIKDGDIYEMNYCRYFEGDIISMDSSWMLSQLFEDAGAPFSVYMKWADLELFCASPERFLAKRGSKLISQPIKGTIKRGRNTEEDLQNQNTLYNSEKDRAEHVMIVDLVRNDLSRSCQPGTVIVEELYGIYPFNAVTQMISTITGELAEGADPVDALANCFPMGSMTGAPKIRAMQLIDQYEDFKRSVFSSAVGYWDDEGDFDFNVVIRSMMVDLSQNKLFIPVGGAIVYDSKAEAEYEESLLKAEGLLRILNINKSIHQ